MIRPVRCLFCALTLTATVNVAAQEMQHRQGQSEEQPSSTARTAISSETKEVAKQAAPPAGTAFSIPTKAVASRFRPPDEDTLPDNEFGKAVRFGKQIFVDTQTHAKKYVGNGLNCVNCHLDNGRKADSAPLWAAYVVYPAYRAKTGKIDTIQSRIQGCFMYSMNGTPPEWNSDEMTALVSYHYWLSTGAPSAVKMPGQGFIKVPEPKKTPDVARGKEVFKNNCALCHGDDGKGRKVDGKYVFPPLWGPDSFNWGAGMHRIDTAAGFVKKNMPYGAGDTLTDQQAWDVALYMNSQDRPKDPRFTKSIDATREEFHDENCLYGRTPEELAALLAEKKKAKPEKPKMVPDQPDTAAPLKPVWLGDSPATAHEVPPVGR